MKIVLMFSICAGFMTLSTFAIADDDVRRNLSANDVVEGFEAGNLSYFEVILTNGKYQKTFNKCLKSMPADKSVILEKWIKNPEFKNAFLMTIDSSTHLFFIYEQDELCEKYRKPMKEKMDAIREG